MSRKPADAVVVGSGPNGLAAAITLARAGWRVTVFEQADSIGGGMRTAELTLPGFRHDVCAAVHPLAVASPFIQTLPLAEHGLEWVFPDVQAAHPLPGGSAALLYRSLEDTAAGLGSDSARYNRFVGYLARRWHRLGPDLLAPLHFPRHPVQFSCFGLLGILPSTTLGRLLFRTEAARALFAGMAAHSFLSLDSPLTGAFGLILTALGHAAGWPVARGGSGTIAEAMASCLTSLGGEIVTSAPIHRLQDLASVEIVMLDITPRQLLSLAVDSLPPRYLRTLGRYRYGPGVFKIDWALSGPIPWEAAGCCRAATVHVGGTAAEVAAGEREVSQGRHPERPFVLVVQPALFDPSRAPADRHVGWAYCHVPSGSTTDMTELMEAQIERFAPGFRRMILARHTRNCREYERYNPNLVGGDVNGGLQDFRQFLVRPTLMAPYRTPLKGVYLCSSSTPPGGGVHGMCGYHAATLALRDRLSGC